MKDKMAAACLNTSCRLSKVNTKKHRDTAGSARINGEFNW
jgi:hypothetical protein